MFENFDFYIFMFYVFFLVKILEFQQKIPFFDANPSNYSFIRGLKRKKKTTIFGRVLLFMYYNKFTLRAINVVPNIVDDREDTLGVLESNPQCSPNKTNDHNLQLMD